LAFANLKSPLPRYNKVEVVNEEVVASDVIIDESATTLENDSTTSM
jgi:hypothetical protein